MMTKKRKSPINRSILIGCGALIIVLSLLLSLETRAAFTNALYDQYETRLRDVVTAVERSADADDLQECIRTGVSSPKRDELQKMINVLMDDFGSGYSSLNMLRTLSVDVIKLDAQFLRMNGDDSKGVHILESIVGMAK